MMSSERLTKYDLHEHYMRVRARLNRRIVEVAQIMEAATVPNISELEVSNANHASQGAVKAIIQHVSAHYNVTPQDILSDRRTLKVALARQVACYVARKTTGYSFPQIGRKMGRDHTTVIYAVERIEQLIKDDPDFAEAVAEMVAKFQGHTQEMMRQFAEKQAMYLRG